MNLLSLDATEIIVCQPEKLISFLVDVVRKILAKMCNLHRNIFSLFQSILSLQKQTPCLVVIVFTQLLHTWSI